MSIFGKIKDAIFGGSAEAAEPTTASNTATTPAAPTAPTATAPLAPAAPQATVPQAPVSQAAPASQPAPAAQPTTSTVDVMANLEATAKAKGGDLNWKSSIVDLMKLLDLDSSLANRKELAKELNYPGEADGSAEMNIWLHKAVMRELAKNGGKVPAELTD